MIESAINRRKSQLFLTHISPVYDTHDEVVKKKLKRGKFPQTISGIIKMVSLCLQLGSLVSWIVLERDCSNASISYTSLSSISIGFTGQLLLFLMFSFGKTIKDPGAWINSDIAFNFIVSLLAIVSSVLSLKSCSSSVAQHLSAILGIGGASCSICACAALFLMYRFVEDADTGERQTKKPVPRDPRKSIFA